MNATVFISYAREDRSQADALARELIDRGWPVWLDNRIGGGQQWKQEIEKALAATRCVVVLWSHASVHSSWVLDEADEGQRRGILLPILLDDVEIPLGFRQVQAIDLARGTDRPDDGVGEVIEAVARILRSPPARSTDRYWTMRLLRSWAAPAVTVALVATAALLQFVRLEQTGVTLEATVSEMSFVLAQEHEVLDLTVVAAVEATGLASIRIPRTRTEPAVVLDDVDGRGLAIRLSTVNDTSHAGTLTLAPIALSAGAHVTLRTPSVTEPYHISFRQSALPLRVNVQGSVEFGLHADGLRRADFGAPKPLVLEPAKRPVDLAIMLSGASPNLLPAPLSITGLTLLRIDERLEAQRTSVQMVSTITSGTLRFDGLAGRQRTLDAGEGLRFGTLKGELRALHLTARGLSLTFQGAARRIESCSGDNCVNWMPTQLERITAERPPFLIAVVAAYLVYVAIIARRWRRARVGIR